MGEAQIITGVDRNLGMPSTSGGVPSKSKAANEADIRQQARSRLASLSGKGLRTTVFYSLVSLIIYLGWQNRGHVYMTPEEGLGYALGIFGGSLMLLLMLYPMRKHMHWMRNLGAVRHWFRSHMLLGIIGPVCILYHCNFQLGSTNGNIALFSMLLVASSGLIGRYFYTRIHYGLYGKKADLASLSSDAAVAKSLMDKAFAASPALQARLQKIETQALSPLHTFLPNMMRLIIVAVRTRWYWITTGPALRKAIRNSEWCSKLTADQRRFYYRYARHHLQIYLRTVRKVAGLSFYERLFATWHILHLPLFIMLVITGFVHVYAVHMY